MSYQSIYRPNLFQGAVVLVTGGGTGIGRTIAHEVVSLGATVVIAARRRKNLERVCEDIKSRNYSGKVDWVEMSIRDADSVKTAIETILTRHKRLTHLVNNAGGQFMSAAAEISLKGWQSVIDLNLSGTWIVTRAVFDAYMRENGGSIVNITVSMKNGFPMMCHSGAARAGIENMSKTLAAEWGPFGIRVNCVSPGSILGNGLRNYPESVLEVVAEETHFKNPAGRLGTESEIAAAVCFLLSRGAAYITGTTIQVDGGITLTNRDAPLWTSEMNLKPFFGYDKISDIAGAKELPKNLEALYLKYTKARL